MSFSVGPGIQLGGGIILGDSNLGPPTVGTATQLGSSATWATNAVQVPFNPPIVGCGTIVQYIAKSVPGGIANTGTTSPITVTGLTYGQNYAFTVQAINSNSNVGVASRPTNTVNGYGTLYTWGQNSHGQLGLNLSTNYNTSSPTQISTSSWITGVNSSGGINMNTYAPMFAIRSDNTLWFWGSEASYGTSGLGISTAYYSSPKQVGALTTWLQVSASYVNAGAITTDGKLYMWGSNSNGQLGDNTAVAKSSPVQIASSTGTTWTKVAVGSSLTDNHTLAVNSAGQLFAWGYNGYGQLGLGNAQRYSSPKQVGLLTNWSNVSAGYYGSMAIKTDGSIWTWGYNGYGQLGTNNTTNYSSPKQIGASKTWGQIAMAYGTAAAVATDNSLYIWGQNSYGVLGSNNLTQYQTPRQVGTLTTWAQISHSGQHALAIKTDGTLWSWGYNNNGQLGLGNVTNYSSPKQVGSLNSWHTISAVGGVSSQGGTSVGITTNFAPVGSPPTQITAVSAGATLVKVSFTPPSPATGLTQSYVVTSNPGSLSTTTQNTSTVVNGLTNGINYTFTVQTSNSVGTGSASTSSNITSATSFLSAWGNGTYGVLAQAVNVSNFSSPKTVGSLANWQQVSSGGGYHVGAIDSTGKLWMWGLNTSGQLANNTLNNYSSPINVGSGSQWVQVATGNAHTLAIDTNGKLWAWGNGSSYGALGLGNKNSYSSPKQVGSSTNWVKVAAGFYASYGLKSDGTLWAWGQNSHGELGLNNATSYSSPMQISGSSWINIAAGGYYAMGIQTGGTLWAWGYNTSYNLGNGANSQVNSPQQVGSSVVWASVYPSPATSSQHTLGLSALGILYAWGDNTYGELGQNNTTLNNYNTAGAYPVGTGTWSAVGAGASTSYGVTTDGRWFSWGYGTSYGQLGLGNATTNYSSPRQLGALTNWLQPTPTASYAVIATHG